jgi:hypothetical protein
VGLIKNNRGSAMIASLALVSAIMVVTGSVATVSMRKMKSSSQMNVSGTANQIKEKMSGLVVSPSGWQLVETNNQEVFDNAANSQSYSQLSSDQKLLKLYISTPGGQSVYYDSTNFKAGFNMSGEPCTSEDGPFNPETGNNRCPFRYEVFLKERVMRGTTAIDTVVLYFKFKPASNGLVLKGGHKFAADVDLNNLDSTNPYIITIRRNFDKKSVVTSCIALDGEYNTDSGECSVKITRPADCDQYPGQYYSGPGDSDGCGAVANVSSCSRRTAVEGFAGGSQPVCGQIQN